MSVPEGRNILVVVEALERFAEYENDALVGIEFVRVHGMQGLAVKGALALLYVAQRVVDAEDKRAALDACLPDGVGDVGERVEAIEDRVHIVCAKHLEDRVLVRLPML